MAVITPDSVIHENFGDTTLHIADFTGINTTAPETGDIYNSSLQAVVGYWFHVTDDPTTQTSGRLDVSLISASTGQFRFRTSETGKDGKLTIMSLY